MMLTDARTLFVVVTLNLVQEHGLSLVLAESLNARLASSVADDHTLLVGWSHT